MTELLSRVLNDITPPASNSAQQGMGDAIVYLLIVICAALAISGIFGTITYIHNRSVDKKDFEKREQMQNEEEKGTEKEEMSDLPVKVKPIRCPKCGSVELAFVSSYQKAILLRVVSFVLFLLAAFIFLFSVLPGIFSQKDVIVQTVMTISSSIFGVLAWVGFLIRESETHVQAICRNCGHIWLLN